MRRSRTFIQYIIPIILMYGCKKENLKENNAKIIYETIQLNNVDKFDISIPDSVSKNTYSLLGYSYDFKIGNENFNKGIRKKIISDESLLSNRLDILRAAINEYNLKENNNLSDIDFIIKYKNDIVEKLPKDSIVITNYIHTDNILRYYTSRLNSDDFQFDIINELNNLDEKEIVQKYGTHILTNIYTGFAIHIVRYKNNEKVNKNIKTEYWENIILAMGSDIQNIIFSNNEINWSPYIQSYNSKSNNFLSISTMEEQMFIYELLPDGKKKENLKKYIQDYLNKK